ncbi:IS982 family transposase [Mucilaginibacter mali]|uniref:IS982 family transposase n=1 Tax=Mucilaginibacter mali TaxID=2740462 RepID=A0A7D4UQI9_9SPHI|nr:IS982 family transposase [Mucilaginibacter mali]QKJ33100.1 IS982 family transposase [Mucilaginibacter mali]
MLTKDKIIGIFCFIDDLLKTSGHHEDSRRQVSDSEVITTAIVSSLYFGGHQDRSRCFMKMMNFVPRMLDKSRFNRRLHALAELICSLFMQIGWYFKYISCEMSYVLDSFPVAVCDNIRISNCKLLQGKQWRGKQSSMRRYFYGIKVQLLVTKDGIPVEFGYVPGSENDSVSLKKLPMNLPAESEVFADSAYTNYEIEDQLMECDQIALKVHRKSNAKRKDSASAAFIKEYMRKRVETTISEIKGLFLRKIHAVTFKGWLLKITLFIFAFTLNKIV